ncbi:hypothetical protein DMENIID0001_094230 [Sergentomyia squamirostris]
MSLWFSELFVFPDWGFVLLFLSSIPWSVVGDVSHLAASGVNNRFSDDLSLLRNAARGEPNVDFPIYSEPPQTSFTCAGRHDGYYADTETRCQVFRVCANTDLTGHGFAFLCPNGTLFNQRYFVCDWHYNVNCGESHAFYAKNEELGKKIESHEHMMTMVKYMQNFVASQPFGVGQSSGAQTGSGLTNFQSGGGSNVVPGFDPSLISHAAGSSFGQAFTDSSSSASSAANFDFNNHGHQKIYVSNLGELSTEPGSGFDHSKSQIINQNLDYHQSGISQTIQTGGVSSGQSFTSQPFHGKFNAIFTGSGNLIGLGSHIPHGDAKFSGSSAVQSNSVYIPPKSSYIPPPPQNAYIPPRQQVFSGSNFNTQQFPSFPSNLTYDSPDLGLFPEDNFAEVFRVHSVKNRDVSSQENFTKTDKLPNVNGSFVLKVPPLDLLPPLPSPENTSNPNREVDLRNVTVIATDLLPPYETQSFETTEKVTLVDHNTPFSIFVPDETTTELIQTMTTETLLETTEEPVEKPAQDLLPPFDTGNSIDNTTELIETTMHKIKNVSFEIEKPYQDLLPPYETTLETTESRLPIGSDGSVDISSEKSVEITTTRSEETTTDQIVETTSKKSFSSIPVVKIPYFDLLPPFESDLRSSVVNRNSIETEEVSERNMETSSIPSVESTTAYSDDITTRIPEEISEIKIPAIDLLPPFEENNNEVTTDSSDVVLTTENITLYTTSLSPETLRTDTNTEEFTESSTLLSEKNVDLDENTTEIEESGDHAGNNIVQVGLSSKSDIPMLVLELLPPKEDISWRDGRTVEENTAVTITTISQDEVQPKELNDVLIDLNVMMANMSGFLNNQNDTTIENIPTTETLAFTEEQTTFTIPTTTTILPTTTRKSTTKTRVVSRTRTTYQPIPPRGFATKSTEVLTTTTISSRDSKDYARRLRNRMRQFQYVSQHSPAFTTPTVPGKFPNKVPSRFELKTRFTTTKPITTTAKTTTVGNYETSTKSSFDLQVTTTPQRVSTTPHVVPTIPQRVSTTQQVVSIPAQKLPTTTSQVFPTTPQRIPTVPQQVVNTLPENFPTFPQTTTTTAPIPSADPQDISPLLDIRFGDDEPTTKAPSDLNAPSMYFSLPLSPIEIKERELKRLGLLRDNVQDSAKEESALFPQRVQFTQRFDAPASASVALPLTATSSQVTSTSHQSNPIVSNFYQTPAQRTPQVSNFLLQRFSPSARNEKVTDIQIVPVRGYYFNDPNERREYYDAVARGLFNEHVNGYVYVKPQLSPLQNVAPRFQRVPTVPKQHELQHSGSNVTPLKVLEARDTEGSIFRGFDSYAAPLNHVGQLPSDRIYSSQSHPQNSLSSF